jgi:hypothetical protein
LNLKHILEIYNYKMKSGKGKWVNSTGPVAHCAWQAAGPWWATGLAQPNGQTGYAGPLELGPAGRTMKHGKFGLIL